MSTSTLVFTSAAIECEFIALPEFQFCLILLLEELYVIVGLGFLHFLKKFRYVVSLVALNVLLVRDFL